ncbi:MAG TPA: alpha/beta fold hydrolase [Polyangiaceae bacterium]|nr:alpha/beta fold hydrolase [Polyangiaceae bacterium]
MGSRIMRRAAFIFAAALVPALPAWLAYRSYRAERRGFTAKFCPPRLSPAEFFIPRLVAVSFTSPGANRLRGVFAPSSNGAAVVLTHGAGGERSDVAREAKILSDAGFGVLAFDWPGHGQSEGQIQWGAPERDALGAAIDWLSAQPSIDSARIGAFGFSMGGYIVAQAGAADQRIKAVALAGTPHDAVEHTKWEYRHWGALSQWPALLAVRAGGMKVHERVPERVIGSIAPRPVLIISGSQDDLVPPWMARRLFDAARVPKTLVDVPGARHGDYADAAPKLYAQTLLTFFAQLL